MVLKKEESFASFDLKPELDKILKEIGYLQPTKIQLQSFYPIMEDKDIVGMSQTGTGKTAAFALPILQRIEPNKCTQVLVLCPTRELSEQILGQFRIFTKYLENVKCLSIFGGQRIDSQIRLLRKGVSIVIGTPGRVLDHLGRRTLKLNNLKTLVLDEADEMLKMGFKEDIERIFIACPKIRQTLLFSATIPDEIKNIIDSSLIAPVYIEIEKQIKTADVNQYYLDTRKSTKEKSLIDFLKSNEIGKTIIFSNTKAYSEKINKLLLENKFNSLSLNGDMSQRERKIAMDAFRSSKVQFLVATDIAARGLDVKDIDFIINYDFPQNNEQYVHRIGRTARAGKRGNSITLVSTGKQFHAMKSLQKELNITIKSFYPNDEEENEDFKKKAPSSKNKKPKFNSPNDSTKQKRNSYEYKEKSKYSKNNFSYSEQSKKKDNIIDSRRNNDTRRKENSFNKKSKRINVNDYNK